MGSYPFACREVAVFMEKFYIDLIITIGPWLKFYNFDYVRKEDMRAPANV